MRYACNGRLSVRRVGLPHRLALLAFAVRDNLCRRAYPLNSTLPVQHGFGVQVVPICQGELGREHGDLNPRLNRHHLEYSNSNLERQLPTCLQEYRHLLDINCCVVLFQ